MNGYPDTKEGEKAPPESQEAERHLIAAALIDEGHTVGRAVQAGIDTDTFYMPAHKVLWSVIVDLWAGNAPATIDTLISELRTRKQLEAVGGVTFLIEMASGVPTTSHAGYFIEKLSNLRRLRAILKAAQSAVEQVNCYTENIDELVSNVAEEFNRALQGGAKREDKIQSVAAALAEETERAATTGQEEKRNTVSWGLIDLDRKCRPMEPGEMIVLGGRPSTGKSALADQVAWQTAAKGGHVLLFTYEMTKREKAIRIAQQVVGRNYQNPSAMPRDQAADFTKAFLKIRDCPQLHVYERDTSASRVVARCRSFASQHQIRLIVVDFLQYLARLEPTIGKERTDEKIGRLTAALKDVARECKCPVLLLASLNREGERENRAPRMSDLRASGEIESDADVIALLHWPHKTPQGEDQDAHDDTRQCFYVEFNQEKGRNKGVHQVGLTFNRPATRFQNFTV